MQPFDRIGQYTDAEVIDGLTGRRGSRQITYRYDRLSSTNVYLGSVDHVQSCEVSNNHLADIKRTARFEILDRTDINYLSDRIRPWVRLAMPATDGRRGYVEWPLGVFLLATPSRSSDAVGTIAREVEGYDQLLALQQDKFQDRYTVAAGTAYTTAIATLAFGFATAITPSASTLPTAMEWEPGASKLRAINDLLDAINYESASFDELGTLICRPYLSPDSRASEYTYAAGAFGVVRPATGQTIDLFDIPNRIVAIKSEADQTPLRSVVTNTNPASPTSTLSRGRTITEVYQDVDVVDQATLDAWAARKMFEASQVYEVLDFETPAMPMHSNADVLTLDLPNFGIGSVKYSEQSWTLPLEIGGTMSHKARRVVRV